MDMNLADTRLRAETGVPVNAPSIIVDGVRLAVAREGHGPAVLCLHATGHGGRDFERFAALTHNNFEVVRLDWPGQGRSDDDMHPASALRYGDLIEGVLDALDLDRVILLGCSIGGAAAIRFAHAHSNRVRGLVLCNPGGLAEIDGTARRAIGLLARFFAAGEGGGGRWMVWPGVRGLLQLPDPAITGCACAAAAHCRLWI